MTRLWFENAFGEERVISENCETMADVRQCITNFILQANNRRNDNGAFVWYYTRLWRQDDGRTRIDVGSHTEFFIWEKALIDA